MTTAQPNLFELAKQGDTKAIATLINFRLQPDNITAKISLKDSCLHVVLESTEVPKQQVVLLIQEEARNLKLNLSGKIKKIKVYGRRKDTFDSAWNQEFEVEKQTNLSWLAPKKLEKATTRLTYKTLLSRRGSLQMGGLAIVLAIFLIGNGLSVVSHQKLQVQFDSVKREIDASLPNIEAMESHLSKMDSHLNGLDQKIKFSETYIRSMEQRYPNGIPSSLYQSYSELIDEHNTTITSYNSALSEYEAFYSNYSFAIDQYNIRVKQANSISQRIGNITYAVPIPGVRIRGN
ncbi:hypothetical protein H6F88_17460 [Oculatella sp. FACHB-28]|uniref:hypothetical protein n=1 Tax=Oculatella sp. FACHB-28 TaxID=2692845 RepID=UPI0016875FC9|nr:hypothetical protein [Oculatella sp. FACHB-28]MBD2057785.1 hypothetical protein [Oculatella sp. FACHB-28]